MQGAVVRWCLCTAFAFVTLVAGCRGGDDPMCPTPTIDADPQAIEEGTNETTVFVAVVEPDTDGERDVVTMLYADSGTFADPSARTTAYRCAHDFAGPIQLCVDAGYGANEDVGQETLQSEQPIVGVSYEHLRRPHVVISNPDDCLETDCVTVTCPERKNICPVIEDLTVTPMTIPPGETQSLVRVQAYDPDAVNPEPLVTRLSATTGIFDNVTAEETLYTCGAPGEAEICVVASDGDESCATMHCTTVQCPSTIPVNLCPSLYILNAIPSVIPNGQNTALIEVRAMDLDDKLYPLVTTLRASPGSLDDVHAEDAVYTCAGPGKVEICADTTDGACMKTACIGVFCLEE